MALRKMRKTKEGMYRVQRYSVLMVKEKDDLERVKIACPADVLTFVNQRLVDLPLEEILVIAMDNGNRIMGYQSFKGTTNQCAVYLAEVFKFLLNAAASSFVVAHNHPGGNRSPSESDWKITNKLHRIGKLMDVVLRDHIIVADDYVSMRDLARWPE